MTAPTGRYADIEVLDPEPRQTSTLIAERHRSLSGFAVFDYMIDGAIVRSNVNSGLAELDSVLAPAEYTGTTSTWDPIEESAALEFEARCCKPLEGVSA
ncbi:hypothetical protein [Nocardia sp. NPDC051750]|uniref:hypothetical protein n=1 Tax=Nocardia sp. NPDC051750 TaxID=3364325 RepID=UPI0037997B47